MNDKRVSDMGDDEIRELAGATESPAASDERDLLRRAAAALMDCAKSVLAVKPSLDQPYPDHPGWTPYTRWVERPAEQAVGIVGEIREHLRTLKSRRDETTVDRFYVFYVIRVSPEGRPDPESGPAGPFTSGEASDRAHLTPDPVSGWRDLIVRTTETPRGEQS